MQFWHVWGLSISRRGPKPINKQERTDFFFLKAEDNIPFQFHLQVKNQTAQTSVEIRQEPISLISDPGRFDTSSCASDRLIKKNKDHFMSVILICESHS